MKKTVLTLLAAMLMTCGAFAQKGLSTKPTDNSKKAVAAAMPQMRQMMKRHAARPAMYGESKTISDTISTFPYTTSFDNGMGQWSVMGGDNEGHNWQPIGPQMDILYDTTGLGAEYAHSGADALVSWSYYPDSMYLFWGIFPVLAGHAVNADNYLVSPAVSLPAGAAFSLAFWTRSLDDGYPDSIEVLVATSQPSAVSDFDTVLIPFAAADGEFARISADLSGFAGQTIWIAFHHAGSDNYGILIDDLRIGGLEAPEMAISNLVRAKAGDTVAFTATSVNGVQPTAATWSFADGAAVTDSGLVGEARWDSAGTYQVMLFASNAAGTDTAYASIDIFDCGLVSEFPYTTDFSEGPDLGCWESVDRNNDGKTWSYYEGVGAINWSYDTETESPITPDDLLVSPRLEIPAAQNFEVYYEIGPGNTSYPEEHYSVYAYNADSAFESVINSPLFSETLAGATSIQTLDLSAFAGQDIRIAFRHHDCSDQVAIALYGVVVRPLSAPVVEIAGPASARMGDEVTFTSGTSAACSWTFDGAVNPTATGSTATAVWAVAGQYTVTCVATNAAGTDSDSFVINIIDCGSVAQFPWSSDFEDGSLGCWQADDRDGDGYTWDAAYLYGEGAGHNSSEGFASSASYINNLGPLTPDNTLISPAIALPEGTSRLTWYAKGQDASYCAENYSVYVITDPAAGFDPAATPKWTGVAGADWEQKQISLTPYGGQTIAVAFRHHDVTDMFYLDVDDIVVDLEQAVGIENAANASISVYPNPAHSAINVSGEGIRQIQIVDASGRVVIDRAAAGSIDISSLGCGVYFLRVIVPEGVRVEKIVKK